AIRAVCPVGGRTIIRDRVRRGGAVRRLRLLRCVLRLPPLARAVRAAAARRAATKRARAQSATASEPCGGAAEDAAPHFQGQPYEPRDRAATPSAAARGAGRAARWGRDDRDAASGRRTHAATTCSPDHTGAAQPCALHEAVAADPERGREPQQRCRR